MKKKKLILENFRKIIWWKSVFFCYSVDFRVSGQSTFANFRWKIQDYNGQGKASVRRFSFSFWQKKTRKPDQTRQKKKIRNQKLTNILKVCNRSGFVCLFCFVWKQRVFQLCPVIDYAKRNKQNHTTLTNWF